MPRLRPGKPYFAGAPLLMAHRGGAGLAPENTLEAFRNAVEVWGADALELDVRATADGHIVVIHDATVDRTTDGTGRVAAFHLKALRQLDAGHRFTDPEGRASFRGTGVRVPLLDEVLDAFPHTRLNVETKERRATVGMLEVIRRHRAEHRVLFAASHETDRAAARGYPGPWGASERQIRWFYLLHATPFGRLYTPGADALQVPDTWQGRRVVTPRFIREAHARNIAVHVWTVDDVDDMRRLLEWEVDGVQTDRPDRLARLLCSEYGRPGAGGGARGGGVRAMRSGSLTSAFADHWHSLGVDPADGPLVIAVSGGLDSVVLLHLLRFHVTGMPTLHVAHFDHAMRPGSEGDARWVAGLTRAWDVDASFATAAPPPRSEAEARTARYDFLHGVRERIGAPWIVTAHHADDQAETVLFRVLRGTGLRGLAGIPERRDDTVLRPLLPFWRSDIQDHAARCRLSSRLDPSNADRSFARNRIRHDVLPWIEREIEPGARRALVQLAALARANEEAWEEVLPGVLEGLDMATGDTGISVARANLLAYDPTVRARVLRALARRLGGRLSAAGTEAALTFAARGASGRRLELPGDLVLARSFDRLEFSVRSEGASDRPLEVPNHGAGAGGLHRRRSAVPGPVGTACGHAGSVERTVPGVGSGIPPPVPRLAARRSHARGLRDERKVARLFAEARLSAGQRNRSPVLVDAEGQVLWLPGVARGPLAEAEDGDLHFSVGTQHATKP